MRDQIITVLNLSKKLQAIRNKDNSQQERLNVIDFLNKIPKDELASLKVKFEASNSQKINKIRLLVVDFLLEKGTITIDDVENIKSKVAANHEENILHSWKSYFSLFLPFLYQEKMEMEDALKNIAEDVINKLGLDNLVKLKIVDFDGANNFGMENAWIAIYNKKQPKQSTSLQLFIQFSGDHVNYGIYRHAKKDTETLKTINIENFEYAEMISFLEKNKQVIIDDNLNIKCWKFSPGEGAKYWEIMQKEGIAAIGWSNQSFIGKNPQHIKALLPKEKSKTIGIVKLFNEAKVGDRIIAFKGRELIIGYGEITEVGLYSEQEVIPNSKFHNYHKVKWIEIKPIKVEYVPMDTFADISDRWPELSNDLSKLNLNVPHIGHQEFSMNNSLNQILYGPPGTGKTYNTVTESLKIFENTDAPEGAYEEQKKRFDSLKQDGRIEFVTFHQSFSYEDFVEGVRAETTEDERLKYSIKRGVFKEISKKAKEDINQPYILIIDEINRGNTSKIFGELITLIEDTKRYGNDEVIEVTLPYSGDQFSVPNNLYIIGTMNTADRSLALIDTALRRRFDFIEMMPDPELILDKDKRNPLVIDGVKIQEMLKAINNRIEALYDREHTIGHAFFMKLNENSKIEDLGKVFKNKILPLLEEYFFEDWEKICSVLGGAEIYKPKDFKNIGFESISKCYERVEEALNNPETYRAIYNDSAAPTVVETNDQ